MARTDARRPPGRIIVRLLAVTLPLYFAWEMLQAPAFTGMPEDWKTATVLCALAALGDAVIVLVLFVLAALGFRDPRWFSPPRIGRYSVVVLAGVAVQMAVEWLLVHRLHLWGYTADQPLVLGIGVLVVLQPILLLPLTLWGLARWETRSEQLTLPSSSE